MEMGISAGLKAAKRNRHHAPFSNTKQSMECIESSFSIYRVGTKSYFSFILYFKIKSRKKTDQLITKLVIRPQYSCEILL